TRRTRTELVALNGDGYLERIQWLDSGTGVVETHEIRHLFMMTGAVPNTGWLDGGLALDGRGFLKTGPDLSPEDLATGGWPVPLRAIAWADPSRGGRSVMAVT